MTGTISTPALVGPALIKACAGIAPHIALFTSAKLSAVCAPVAVGIGIAVAYLTLDRFRYHKRIVLLTAKLTTVLPGPAQILKNAANNNLTQVERNFLALHSICGTPEIKDGVVPYKKEVFNGGLDMVLSGLLTFLVSWKGDRFLTAAFCFFLCMWELYVSFILFTADDPPNWLGSRWSELASFGGVLAAYVIPLIGFALGEIVLMMVKHSVTRWLDEENVRQARAAAAVNTPEVAA